jgi:shikimate kinase
MLFRSYAYAAGTVVNAVATGKGCAFAVDLKTYAEFTPEDRKEITDSGKRITSHIINRIFNRYGISGRLELKSEIPRKSGLGSSSAFVNAVLLSILKSKNEELNPLEILKDNAEISLKNKISYTGAFDDAAASLLGGMVITDNLKFEILMRKEISKDVLILIPDTNKKIVKVDRVRRNTELVEKALERAMNGDFMNAMLYNSLYYCRLIGYPIQPVMDAKEIGISAGLSGNGPTYIAFGSKKEIEELENTWKKYGKLIRTKTVSEPCEKKFLEFLRDLQN